MDYEEMKALDEVQLCIMAEGDVEDVKGYSAWFVQLESYGYSVLVTKNGRRIDTADDYELHHRGKAREELRKLYMKELNKKLFTDEELRAPSKSYTEHKAKRDYVLSIYPLQREHMSMFDGEKPDGWVRGGLYYFPPYEKAFARSVDGLLRMLKSSEPRSYGYMLGAFHYEMRNHEYVLDYDGDYAVMSLFANIGYHAGYDTEDYLKATGWSSEWKRAYRDAQRKYWKDARENDWG